jgi:hypothetical protein
MKLSPPFSKGIRYASWLLVVGSAVPLLGCGGGGGGSDSPSAVSAAPATGAPVAAPVPTPCVKSVTSGFIPSGDQNWNGTPQIGGGGDGASSGGADGDGGAAAGGDFGKVVGARVVVKDDKLATIGEAVTDQTGLVTIKPCSYSGPLLVEFHGQAGAKYFDESLRDDVDFPSGTVLRLAVSQLKSNLVVSPHTNAAFEFLNSDGSVLASSNDAASSVSRQTKALTSNAIDQANNSILSVLDGHLPGIHRLQSSASVTRLPILLDLGNFAQQGVLPDNDRGRYAATLAGLAKAARGFRPDDRSPMLSITQQLAADLSDGKLDLRKKGVPVSAPTGLTYTFESLWLSTTVGAGGTSTIIGDDAMRKKVVPVSRSFIQYGLIPLSFSLGSDGLLSFTYSDERAVQSTRPVDGNYVELNAFAGRAVSLTSDRKTVRLAANSWELAPPTAGTTITWLDQDERGLLIRDSNGKFWRNAELLASTSPWTALPYGAEFLSAHSGFNDKVYGLSQSGRVFEWALPNSLSKQTQLPIDGVVQISNHAEHGMVLALTADRAVYWLNRNEVPVVVGGQFQRDPVSREIIYGNPAATPLLIAGLPASGICWISGSYLAACDGSVYKIEASSAVYEPAVPTASDPCRSWATGINGVTKINFPLGVKIWRITTQKSPPYKATKCNGVEITGESPNFFSEDGAAYQLGANLTPAQISVNAPTAALKNCIPKPDEGLMNFVYCNDVNKAPEFQGTFRGTWPKNTQVSCQFSFDALGNAVFDTPDGRRMTAKFDGDEFDRIAYWRHPTNGDASFLSVTNNPRGRDGPRIEFAQNLQTRLFSVQGYFTTPDASGDFIIECNKAVRIR